jgi:hypothetical protein
MFTITLLKRSNDQLQGTVTTYTLNDCRPRTLTFIRTGEALQGDMLAGDSLEWVIPRIELERVGVLEINPLDRIVDHKNRIWQPEAMNTIAHKLGENYINVSCKRLQ